MSGFFDATAEAERLKAKANLRIKKRYSISKLDKFKHQILTLREAGSTLAEIQIFLREKRIKAATSTISRWLAKNG